jgi:hypothetical protein
MICKKVATNLIDLLGQYKKNSSQLVSENLSGYLLIRTRTTKLPNKPPQYLLYKAPDKDLYISGLYSLPSQKDVFRIEWQGQFAFLLFTHDGISIMSEALRSPQYINRTSVTSDLTPYTDRL